MSMTTGSRRAYVLSSWIPYFTEDMHVETLWCPIEDQLFLFVFIQVSFENKRAEGEATVILSLDICLQPN